LVQLQQVLINLLLNAVEACRSVERERRRVVIRTSAETREGCRGLIASVEDAGKGIDPNVRERIFDAFYTTRAEGLGMGLSISRSIVRRHGGELTVSANQPHGATFAFSLPSSSRRAGPVVSLATT
jgi:signal transduction histidine kinase